jgi:DNA uptake protein ComE-like DNA-binding protein
MKWFLAGLGIGVAFGVVIAPARGEESRRKLREGATRAWDEMSDEARTTLDEMRSSDWARQARDAAQQARERVSRVTQNVQQRAGDVAAAVRERAPEPVKQAADRVGSAVSGNGERESGKVTRGSLLELLNEGSQDELIAVNGIGPVLALKIVQNRPYRSEQQPLEDNVVPPSVYEALRNHLKQSA